MTWADEARPSTPSRPAFDRVLTQWRHIFDVALSLRLFVPRAGDASCLRWCDVLAANARRLFATNFTFVDRRWRSHVHLCPAWMRAACASVNCSLFHALNPIAGSSTRSARFRVSTPHNLSCGSLKLEPTFHIRPVIVVLWSCTTYSSGIAAPMNTEPPIASPHSTTTVTVERLSFVRVLSTVMMVLVVLVVVGLLIFGGVMIWLATDPQLTGDFGGMLAGQ